MRITGAVPETSGVPSPFATSRPLGVAELEPDDTGAGELLVRIEVTSACHSDRGILDRLEEAMDATADGRALRQLIVFDSPTEGTVQ